MVDRLTCLVVALMFPALAIAEKLADPTQPPAIIAMPAIAEGDVADSHLAGLHSIIISKIRRAAIIDGETVELGGKHGDAKLIEVNEGSVVLRGAKGRQVMTLFPDVKMTMAKSLSEAKSKPQPAKSKTQPGKQKTNQAASEEKK